MSEKFCWSHPNLRSIWKNMIRRCEDPNDRSYCYYGARGISVCDEWKDKKTFNDWAIASGYQAGLSIDRRDCTLGYCPDNCQWLSRKENSGKTRNTIFLTVNGITDSLKGWDERLGYHGSIGRFYHLRGEAYTIERIKHLLKLSAKPSRRGELIEVDGIVKTAREWYEYFAHGIKYFDRIRREKGLNYVQIMIHNLLNPSHELTLPILKKTQTQKKQLKRTQTQKKRPTLSEVEYNLVKARVGEENYRNGICRRVQRPVTYLDFKNEMDNLNWNYCAMGRKYGVSDNAIRKWEKMYQKYEST